MHYFTPKDGRLFAEDVDITALAEQIGTPFYCYSSATLCHHYQKLADAFADMDATICYSLKANANLAVIATLAKAGAGADIVSGGELQRALKAGIAPEKIVFSGIGKTADEITAALHAGIALFNVESRAELDLLSQLAGKYGVMADIALRINPDIEADTHEKIITGRAQNKFGIAWEDAMDSFAYAKQLPYLKIRGIDMHIGSQITELQPFRQAFEKIAGLLQALRAADYDIDYLDLGGGLGIAHGKDHPNTIDPQAYGELVRDIFGDAQCRLFIEPGRAIAGHAGILVSSVIRTKTNRHKNFIIIDAAMTELLRPTLYGAWHDIVPVVQPTDKADGANRKDRTDGADGADGTDAADKTQKIWDIVGPVCESGDFLGLDRPMAEPQPGDLLAIFTTGAYAAALASGYNSRLPAPEIMVAGDRYHIIRQRPDHEHIMAQETLPDWLLAD